MPAPPTIGRSYRRCVDAARRRVFVESIALGVFVAPFVGCASIGHRGPVPEEVAACRELSRQGASAIEVGQWARAESLLKQAVEASPKDAEPHRYLAEALWHRGAAEDALSQIKAALELDQSDASLAVRAGEMLLAVGKTNDALAHAERAIRLDPKLASAWALRGRVFWQLDQRDRAVADLQRGLQFAPDNSDMLLDMAVLYRQRGQSARALVALRHLRDTYPPGEEPQLPLLLEGQTLVELGRPRQAAESLAAAAQRGPPNADVFCLLAQAELAAGDCVAAQVAVERALATDGSHQASRQLWTELAGHVPPAETQRR